MVASDPSGDPFAGATFHLEDATPPLPSLAVVVASSSDEAALREWLDPIASFAAERGLEVVVARHAEVGDAAEWGTRFAPVSFVHAPGDPASLRRAGAAATRADVLLLTDDMDPGAYLRLVALAGALGLVGDGGEARAE